MAKSALKKLPSIKKTAKSGGNKLNKPVAAKATSGKASVAKLHPSKPVKVAKPVIVAKATKPTAASARNGSAKNLPAKSTVAKGMLSKASIASNGGNAAKGAVAKAAVIAKSISGKPASKGTSGKTSSPEIRVTAKVAGSSKANGNKSSVIPARPVPPAKPEYVSIPDRVATNLKPRKNQAGLTSKELEHFRDLLLEKRREIVGDMSSMEREALRSGGSSNLSTLPIHMADMGTDNYEQEFTLGLVEKDRNLLREINNALAKIQNGTFGICEGTSKPIPKARLEVQPWARFGVEYARQMEKGMMGVR